MYVPNLIPRTCGSYLIWQKIVIKGFERKSVSWIIQVGHKSNNKYSCESEAEDNLTDTTGRHPEEREAAWPRGQRLEVPQTKKCLEPIGAGRCKKQILPWSP